MVDDLLGISRCGNKSLSLNTFINTHIEMKKLKFHTPDATGKTKCNTLHVGKRNVLCPTLSVHGQPMPLVDYDTYLGEIISCDLSNSRNIRNRISKGNGIISQIMTILETVSLGSHYFRIAFLLRESLFLSSVLTNSECWIGLTKTELEDLSKLDRQLLKAICSLPNSTPIPGLYLETGCLRITTIIKARRINFLHYLVNSDKSSMIYKFFMAQWMNPVKNDWTIQVKQDLKDFQLTSDLIEISSISKYSFKSAVKSKALQYDFTHLNLQKQSLSKMKDLHYPKLIMQNYFDLPNMNVTQAKVLMKFRLRMASFGENFRGQSVTIICPLCGLHPDSQSASFNCQFMKTHFLIEGQYNDIFSDNVSSQLVRTLTKIQSFREDSRKNC